MRIVDAKVIVCSPGRNFVTLKLSTEDGLYGLGDATLNGRELAVASYLKEHVVPLLIGRDARRIEDTWHYLYKGAYWRRGHPCVYDVTPDWHPILELSQKVKALFVAAGFSGHGFVMSPVIGRVVKQAVLDRTRDPEIEQLLRADRFEQDEPVAFEVG